MKWRVSRRFDQEARKIADRHYSRGKVGAPDFVGNGSPLVLLAPYDGPAKALWVTLWQSYVRHEWVDAWACTLFRNEGAGLSSELIGEAVAATRAMWGRPPANGIITFVNADKVRPTHKPGWCFRKAGWSEVGETKGGLVVLRQMPNQMPDPMMPHGGQLRFLPDDSIPTNCRSVNVTDRGRGKSGRKKA